MTSVSEMNCPRCGKMMAKAFANASALIPYETPESMLKFIHASGSVHEVPMWKRLLPHAAQYLLTYLCKDCRVYVIDFSRPLSAADAKALAEDFLRRQEWCRP